MLRQLVSVWFQVLSLPSTGFFSSFARATQFTIGRQRVLSLGRWASHLQTGFHVTDPTRIVDNHLLSNTGLSPSLVPASTGLLLAFMCQRADPFSLAATQGVAVAFLSYGY